MIKKTSYPTKITEHSPKTTQHDNITQTVDLVNGLNNGQRRREEWNNEWHTSDNNGGFVTQQRSSLTRDDNVENWIARTPSSSALSSRAWPIPPPRTCFCSYLRPSFSSLSHHGFLLPILPSCLFFLSLLAFISHLLRVVVPSTISFLSLHYLIFIILPEFYNRLSFHSSLYFPLNFVHLFFPSFYNFLQPYLLISYSPNLSFLYNRLHPFHNFSFTIWYLCFLSLYDILHPFFSSLPSFIISFLSILSFASEFLPSFPFLPSFYNLYNLILLRYVVPFSRAPVSSAFLCSLCRSLPCLRP